MSTDKPLNCMRGSHDFGCKPLHLFVCDKDKKSFVCCGLFTTPESRENVDDAWAPYCMCFRRGAIDTRFGYHNSDFLHMLEVISGALSKKFLISPDDTKSSQVKAKT